MNVLGSFLHVPYDLLYSVVSEALLDKDVRELRYVGSKF